MLTDRLLQDDLRRRHHAAAELVRWTPSLSLRSLADEFGAPVSVKAECLQRTGSFKLRGALSKLAALPPATLGVTAGSAGNHGQAVAYAARQRGLECTVFMPRGASVSKVAAVRGFGGQVRIGGDSVDACTEMAHSFAEAHGLVFVHPFDDEDVVRGQAGVGLELAREVDGLAMVVVPVGGGGLAAGVCLALAGRPNVRIVGVQAAQCAPLARWPSVDPRGHSGPSVADGIVIKRPGGLPLRILTRRLDTVVTVDEQAVCDAMGFLLERGKLVVEGAGAVGVAALRSGLISRPPSGVTAVVLSGGNVDTSLLSHVLSRFEARTGRRARLTVPIADRPGALADLLATVAGAEANVLDVRHVRDEMSTAPGVTAVELLLEISDDEHRRSIVDRIGRLDDTHPAAVHPTTHQGVPR